MPEVDQLQLEFGSGSDLVNIVSTHAGRTSIDAGGGADQIRVSSLTGTVAGIHGLLEISAGVDENDVLIVDDSGNSAGVMLQLTSTNLTGFGSASIVYDAVDDLQVNLGSGNDIVLVASTHPGETLIGTGTGADLITVISTGGSTTLLSAAGDDLIQVILPPFGLPGIRDELSISAGDGDHDRLVVDDLGNATAVSAVLTADVLTGISQAPILYSSIDEFELYLGAGDDTVEIAATHAGSTQVDSGRGRDAFFVHSTDGSTTLLSGDDGATYRIGSTAGSMAGLDGPLQIVGTATGEDFLVLDDTGNPAGSTVELTSSTIVGLSPAPIEYAEVDQLQLLFGSGDDVLTIASTHAGTTDVQMKAGNDVVIGRTTNGPTSVDGGAGLSDLLQAGSEVAGVSPVVDKVVLSADAPDSSAATTGARTVFLRQQHVRTYLI